MTSFPDRDLDDVSPSVEPSEVDEPTNLFNPTSHSAPWRSSFKESCDRSLIWFAAIPSSGKLLVLAIGGLLGLTLLKTVLQLVSSLITLLVLGIIFYLVYKFWIAPNSN